MPSEDENLNRNIFIAGVIEAVSGLIFTGSFGALINAVIRGEFAVNKVLLIILVVITGVVYVVTYLSKHHYEDERRKMKEEKINQQQDVQLQTLIATIRELYVPHDIRNDEQIQNLDQMKMKKYNELLQTLIAAIEESDW